MRSQPQNGSKSETQVDELRAKIEELLPLFYERKGFRELCWCPNLNEPVILTYRHEKGKPTLTVCENCGTTDKAYIMESHPFIGSVKKTYEPRDGLVDELINTFTALLVKERIDELDRVYRATGLMEKDGSYGNFLKVAYYDRIATLNQYLKEEKHD